MINAVLIGVVFVCLLNMAGMVLLAVMFRKVAEKPAETTREIIRYVRDETGQGIVVGGTVPDSVVKTYIPRADYDENYDGLIQSGKTKE